jgi:serine phosphatase RsbU (regulator of sigma subunit)
VTCYRIKAFLVGLTRLGREIRNFALWLEARALAAAYHRGCDTMAFDVSDDDSIVCGHRAGACFDEESETPGPPEPYRLVGRLLRQVGVVRIEFSSRLESNQVSDILTLMAVRRKQMEMSEGRAESQSLCAWKCGGGLQYACTKTSIVDGVLSIEYSYCVTRFSRFVRWYKTRQEHFSDHRAIFQAAPKYTLLAAVLAATPPIIYTLMESWLVLVVLTSLAVVAISALIYGFFMTVGSIEYDNEEKAHSLRRANARLEAYASRTGADLQRAGDIQQKLLPDPNRMPHSDRLDWASSFAPETAVGGDYFDAAELGEHRVAIIFTDVSGHGMSAAFVTAIVKTAFQRWVDDGGADIERFVAELNSSLYRMTPDESFAASFIAVYDCDLQRLEYINCGHSPEPMLVPADPDEAIVTLNDARAILLGVLPDLTPHANCKTIAPGDKLLLATDGMTEAMDTGGEQYGSDRLGALIASVRQAAAVAVVEEIVRDVAEFSSGTEQYDDQTVLAMEVKLPERTDA